MRDRQIETDRPKRVIVYGKPVRRFTAVLADAPVWRHFPEVEVIGAASGLELLRLVSRGPCIVLPVWPKHSAKLPHWWWMLKPSRLAVQTLNDKLRFAYYLRRQGLEELAPRSFLAGEAPQFPVVVKPAVASDGRDVSFAANAVELAARLGEPAFHQKPVVVQERLPGDVDIVTHVVCRGGRVLWHASYRYQLPASGVQTFDSIVSITPYRVSDADIASFERLLLPLRYDGPATIDHRRRPGGRLAVFEINPRFGASLLRPENEADLIESLRTLLANAVPPPWWRG